MAPVRNLPNLITGSRLVLALALFILLSLVAAGREPAEASELATWAAGHERLLLNVCLAIFLTAAVSDFLDGYLARRWNLQTDFGRIVDPFADKVIVCGTFVLLVPLKGSQVAPWMVVVILARELLVDGIRGFAEAKGIAFPSMWAGKVKMFFQSNALMCSLAVMANWPQSETGAWITWALVITAIASTLYSGLQYVFHARRVLSGDQMAALASTPTPEPGS
jgi:CDP-diacylglycerol--glycerol-3-phosphate 3-phosphatidyltransferase